MTGEVAAIVSAVTWALANVAFARLPSWIHPFPLTVLKSLIALLMMGTTLVALEGTLWPELDRRATIFLAASAFIGITAGDTAYFHALVRLGARRAVFLGTLVPPSSALAAWITIGEALAPLEVLGMVLTVAGVTLVLLQRTSANEARGDLRAGLAFGLFAVACQVTANILTKEVAAGHSALAISVARLLFGTAGLAVAAVLLGRTREVWRPLTSARPAALVLTATVLGSYFGIWFYMAAIMYTEIGIAVTLCSTSPVFAVVFAHFLLNERATLRAFAGAAIAISGVALLFAG